MSTKALLGAFLLARALSAPSAFPQQPAATASGPGPGQNTRWKHAVIYEIYPRSFADANGDGIGDLNGITRHLDYLQKLGVDAIWIAPMYPSPQVDFGYDISDYENVDPQYGTLRDFDRLQAEGARRHIRVIVDMVLNHTSDKHQWFIESARSKDNPKADWFVWNSGIPASTPGVTALPEVVRTRRHGAAEQLGLTLRWFGLGMGSFPKAVLLPQVLQGTGRPELAQPGGRSSHVLTP